MNKSLTKAERDELRKLAERATPGSWEHYRGKLRPQFGTRINEVRADDDSCAVVAWPGFDDSVRPEKQHAANAKFIARCNPETILALLDEVDRLEAEKNSTAEATGGIEGLVTSEGAKR